MSRRETCCDEAATREANACSSYICNDQQTCVFGNASRVYANTIAVATVALIHMSNALRQHVSTALVRVLGLALLLTSAASAQDDTTGWPGFNDSNTVRGTVTASGTNTFTIRTDDGVTYKVLYSVNSRVMANRGQAKPADIHTGDMLIATGNVDPAAKTVGAAVLIGIDAEEVKKARAGLGKTWTAGKITAVELGDEPRITLDRLDGLKQTFAVDENTSFKHRHESITLADIKAGESLRADGHLSGKTFLATNVYLFKAGEHGDSDPSSAGSGRSHGERQP